MDYELEQLAEVDLRRFLAMERAGVTTALISLLESRNLMLGCAESLTGGLLADAFVQIPGASAVFSGSAVTYETRLKHEVLDVPSALLESHGAVDPEVAFQMAAGVRKVLGVDVALSATGVAGPTPQDGKAVGTVFLGISAPNLAVVIGLDLRDVLEYQERDWLPGMREEISGGPHAVSQREAIRLAAVHVAVCAAYSRFAANG